jgi:hypothetical protein
MSSDARLLQLSHPDSRGSAKAALEPRAARVSEVVSQQVIILPADATPVERTEPVGSYIYAAVTTSAECMDLGRTLQPGHKFRHPGPSMHSPAAGPVPQRLETPPSGGFAPSVLPAWPPGDQYGRFPFPSNPPATSFNSVVVFGEQPASKAAPPLPWHDWWQQRQKTLGLGPGNVYQALAQSPIAFQPVTHYMGSVQAVEPYSLSRSNEGLDPMYNGFLAPPPSRMLTAPPSLEGSSTSPLRETVGGEPYARPLPSARSPLKSPIPRENVSEPGSQRHGELPDFIYRVPSTPPTLPAPPSSKRRRSSSNAHDNVSTSKDSKRVSVLSGLVLSGHSDQWSCRSERRTAAA